MQSRQEIQKAIRAKARVEMSRRVYVLPSDIVVEILDYQAERGLPSEVAAVRELLDRALTLKGHPHA